MWGGNGLARNAPMPFNMDAVVLSISDEETEAQRG